jgi:hypothetical protein
LREYAWKKRSYSASVLIRYGSKSEPVLVEMFDSTLWPDKPEADQGLYRVRIDGRWWMPGRKKYAFVTREAVGLLLAEQMAAPCALDGYDQRKPELRMGDRCRWRPDDLECGQIQVRLQSDAVMWLDGVWRALIIDREYGTRWVCCDELTLLDHFGRELCRLPDNGNNS